VAMHTAVEELGTDPGGQTTLDQIALDLNAVPGIAQILTGALSASLYSFSVREENATTPAIGTVTAAASSPDIVNLYQVRLGFWLNNLDIRNLNATQQNETKYVVAQRLAAATQTNTSEVEVQMNSFANGSSNVAASLSLAASQLAVAMPPLLPGPEQESLLHKIVQDVKVQMSNIRKPTSEAVSQISASTWVVSTQRGAERGLPLEENSSAQAQEMASGINEEDASTIANSTSSSDQSFQASLKTSSLGNATPQEEEEELARLGNMHSVGRTGDSPMANPMTNNSRTVGTAGVQSHAGGRNNINVLAVALAFFCVIIAVSGDF